MSRQTIAVDLDEVLGELVPSVIAFLNETRATNYQLSDFFSYEWDQVLNMSVDEGMQLFIYS